GLGARRGRAGGAEELEGSPEIGVVVAAAELALGLPQGLGRGGAAPVGVEQLHELGGGAVVHVPEAGDHGARAGVEEGPGQANKLVPSGQVSEGGAASAEDDEIGLQAEVVEINHVEAPVGQLERREVGVVAAQAAVGGDMQHSAAFGVGTQNA